MILKISADVQPMEAYKIYVDGELERKVRGTKKVTLELSDEDHIVQLKSASGKSHEIELSELSKEDVVEIKFNTNWLRASKEGYFGLEEQWWQKS